MIITYNNNISGPPFPEGTLVISSKKPSFYHSEHLILLEYFVQNNLKQEIILHRNDTLKLAWKFLVKFLFG